MKTFLTHRLIRNGFLALVVLGSLATTPAVLRADDSQRKATPAIVSFPAVPATTRVLPAAWYDHILSSRTRTVQAVCVLLLAAAFMLRKASW